MNLSPPIAPPPMSTGRIIAFAVVCPIALGCLLFLPAGSIAWTPGWIFLAVSAAAFTICVAIIMQFNPVIFRARSRFQAGTKGWDLRILSVILPAAVSIMPVAALDAGRLKLWPLPVWVIAVGYIFYLVSFAITAWAQGVNEFFEPGVRIQTERHHRVIDTGPYALIRHPGYAAAVLLFAGMALSLGSLLALIPAALASAALALRTAWEDRMLQSDLPGYREYAGRVRSRLLPGVW